MAIKKGSKKETVKEIKKDVATKAKSKATAATEEEEIEEEEEVIKLPVTRGSKKATEVVQEVEATEVEIEKVDTSPDAHTYLVKLDNRKFPGRTAEQAELLVYGALGAAKKIYIEIED